MARFRYSYERIKFSSAVLWSCMRWNCVLYFASAILVNWYAAYRFLSDSEIAAEVGVSKIIVLLSAREWVKRVASNSASAQAKYPLQ